MHVSLIGSYFDTNLSAYNNAELTTIASNLYWQTCCSTQGAERITYASRKLHAAYGVPLEDSAPILTQAFAVVNPNGQLAEVKNRIVALLAAQQNSLNPADR